jgi:hypothetical protein
MRIPAVRTLTRTLLKVIQRQRREKTMRMMRVWTKKLSRPRYVGML